MAGLRLDRARTGAAVFIPSSGPCWLTLNIRSESSAFISTMGARVRIPALFTRMSSPPNRSAARATTARHSSSRVTSSRAKEARVPIDVATSSAPASQSVGSTWARARLKVSPSRHRFPARRLLQGQLFRSNHCCWTSQQTSPHELVLYNRKAIHGRHRHASLKQPLASRHVGLLFHYILLSYSIEGETNRFGRGKPRRGRGERW